MNNQPIAVFDSGLGGLSVVRHLRQQLPGEDIVYFGDTARVPYGTKSRHTVVNFSLDLARFLLQFEPRLLVVACNTASALALPELAAESPVPVIGVVEPGAAAAAQAAGDGVIAVLGTEATVNSGAYPAAIRALAPQATVLAIACPLFVPIVEEGRGPDDPVTQLAVREYLAPLAAQPVKAVVLGCTHYPLLRGAIAAHLGPGVTIIDSGHETALAVRRRLAQEAGLSRHAAAGTLRCFVSDNAVRFRKIGSRFLNQEIEHVEQVEPERYISSAVSPHESV